MRMTTYGTNANRPMSTSSHLVRISGMSRAAVKNRVVRGSEEERPANTLVKQLTGNNFLSGGSFSKTRSAIKRELIIAVKKLLSLAGCSLLFLLALALLITETATWDTTGIVPDPTSSSSKTEYRLPFLTLRVFALALLTITCGLACAAELADQKKCCRDRGGGNEEGWMITWRKFTSGLALVYVILNALPNVAGSYLAWLSLTEPSLVNLSTATGDDFAWNLIAIHGVHSNEYTMMLVPLVMFMFGSPRRLYNHLVIIVFIVLVIPQLVVSCLTNALESKVFSELANYSLVSQDAAAMISSSSTKRSIRLGIDLVAAYLLLALLTHFSDGLLRALLAAADETEMDMHIKRFLASNPAHPWALERYMAKLAKQRQDEPPSPGSTSYTPPDPDEEVEPPAFGSLSYMNRVQVPGWWLGRADSLVVEDVVGGGAQGQVLNGHFYGVDVGIKVNFVELHSYKSPRAHPVLLLGTHSF